MLESCLEETVAHFVSISVIARQILQLDLSLAVAVPLLRRKTVHRRLLNVEQRRKASKSVEERRKKRRKASNIVKLGRTTLKKVEKVKEHRRTSKKRRERSTKHRKIIEFKI